MLRLHVPSREEFPIRQGWLLDPQMMAYNAGWQVSYTGYDPMTGCIDWPEQNWPAFEQRLSQPASQQGYFYVQDDGTREFLGHLYYEVDAQEVAHIGLNVVPEQRRNGLGSEFMGLLLERVWQDTAVAVAANEFEDQRVAAVRLHRGCGFIPDPTTDDALGRPTRVWRLQRHQAGS